MAIQRASVSLVAVPTPTRRKRKRWGLIPALAIAVSLLLVLVLAACGGDDDDADDTDSTPQTAASSMAVTPSVDSGSGTSGQTPAAMPGSGGAGNTPASMPGSGGSTAPTAAGETTPAAAETPAESEQAEPTATTAPSGGGGGSDGGGTVPTQASTDFPDVHLSLEPGSSGEIGATGASDLSASPEKHPLRVTLVSIIDPATIDSVVYTNDPGKRYIAYEMKLEAVGDAPVNTGVWTVGTTDGQVYETLMLTGVGEDIFYGDLQPGETVQGVLVFQIPEDATVEWLFLSPHIYVGGNLIFIAP